MFWLSILSGFVSLSVANIGAYFGFQATDNEPPCPVSATQRKIPGQTIDHKVSILFSGALIFSTIMFEFRYVLDSVWHSYLFGMFGMILVNMCLLFCVVSLVAVLNTYLCIQAQNWKWWWRAYLSGWSAAIYMFVYCVYVMVFEYQMDVFWGDLIYLIYCLQISFMFGALCGAIALISSFMFVWALYSLGRSD